MVGIVEFVSNTAINLIETLGYWGVFLGMTLDGIGVPVLSEVTMTFAGFAVYDGKMSLLGITLVGTLGETLGALIAYSIGREGGRPLLEKYGKYILISHKDLNRADGWFQKYGHEAVLISRVLPILRNVISLPAGITRMDIKKFVMYTFLGSLPWAFALGYIGTQLGPRWSIIEGYFRYLDIVVIVAIVAVLIYVVYKYWYLKRK